MVHESEPWLRGAKNAVFLPQKVDPCEVAGEAGHAAAEQLLRRLADLVADRRALQGAGHRVLVTARGEPARAILRSCLKPSPNVHGRPGHPDRRRGGPTSTWRVANVALPSIGRAFDASQTSLNLIAVGFSWAWRLRCCTWRRDRYGRKLLLLLGIGLSIPAALLASFAWTEAVLIIARIFGRGGCGHGHPRRWR